MIERQPELEKYRKGQAPGLDNPLGARALYIFEGNRDTLYRLHGTNEPWTIGKSVSSGCIRLFNQDIIDLYDRVPVETPIVVIPDPSTLVASAGNGTDAHAVPSGKKGALLRPER
jgi:lipoprotein-anchoring transpeptidase ErfK/SrfK